MKKIIICLLALLAAVGTEGFAQQVNMNVNSNPPAVEQGKTGFIEVNICNVDAAGLNAPANKLRPLISVPGTVTITGVTDVNGNPLAGFTVLSLTPGTGNSIRLLATEPLANFECFDFHVTIQGVNVGPPDVITGTLGFSGPPPVNDIPADNNSVSAVAVTAPLPVTLTRFTATEENGTARLDWETTMETNSDRFEIERSLTGKNWEQIGMVLSNGESASLKQYRFTDKVPQAGENLYRLKMVDRDATYSYSRICSLQFSSTQTDLSVYPNPVSDMLYVRDFEQVRQIDIYDLNGSRRYQSLGKASEKVNVSNLPVGIYVVDIKRNSGGQSSQKIVISR